MTAKRHAAAYDPAADCWLAMPDVPAAELRPDARTSPDTGWSVLALHWTGEELLAELHKGNPNKPLGVVAFDPRTWTWDPGPQGPLASWLTSGILVDGRLLFMTRTPNDRWLTNGTYDPATETWTIADTGCRLQADLAVWTGRLVLEPYARRAYDPATGACFRIPKTKDRSRFVLDPIWTGREFVVWSGAYGDADVAYRDGVVYRPPRKAITDEEAKPIGKKLRRAIAARRERGFDTDPDVVREIMRDPYQPGSRQYGFPMAEAEYWDLNDRSWISSQLEPVRRYLGRLPIYGGRWIDQWHGGRLAIALTEADPDVIARIDSLMPTEPDLGWRLIIVERTIKELRTAQRRAPRVSKELDPTAKLQAWGVDESDHVVTLMYDPDDVKRMRARRPRLEQRLGVPVRITSGRVTDT